MYSKKRRLLVPSTTSNRFFLSSNSKKISPSTDNAASSLPRPRTMMTSSLSTILPKRRKPWCDDLSCDCHISGNRSNKRPRVSFSPTINEEHDSEGPISEHRHFIKELKDEPFDMTWEEDVPPLIWCMISELRDAQIGSKQWVDQVLRKIDGHPAARTMLDTFAQIGLPVGETPRSRRSPDPICSCIWCSNA